MMQTHIINGREQERLQKLENSRVRSRQHAFAQRQLLSLALDVRRGRRLRKLQAR